MRYSKLGRTGLDVSVIGLGMEHLTVPSAQTATVLAALDQGVNYVDLMIWRPELQDSLGACLEGRRDQVLLAGHLGVACTQGQYRRTRDIRECRELFDDLLRRLRTDHVDVLHMSYVDVAGDLRQALEVGGLLELAQQARREGKARFIGMSGHNPATAKVALETGLLDVLMFPVSLVWSANTATLEVCRLCAERGVGLVAMKPFGGGEAFQKQPPLSAPQCLHYTLSQPGVAVALTGVKSPQELAANLACLDAGDAERDFSSALGELSQVQPGTCVYCNHCLPCPADIDIGHTIRLLKNARSWGLGPDLLADYGNLQAKASACLECGDCLDRCPFEVDIIGQLKQAAEVLKS